MHIIMLPSICNSVNQYNRFLVPFGLKSVPYYYCLEPKEFSLVIFLVFSFGV